MSTDYCKHMVPIMKNDTCHICSLEAERDRLRKELEKEQRSKNVMSNYLNELMHNTANTVIASQIYNVLREAVGREEFDPVGQEGEGKQ
ncbi:hypothetical protein GCM10008014_08590 [Paenibacillus silvae]|uniref:Uncharacterized protein n=1 Tax=Paenibacillus silvae TaxID=1325358 RepID=A0ABQ1Z1D9_9BACL|nr:hypothetical protein [Paenibacillus silvae]GGH46131.1 hypothetical protein GCM10008014_08590 [Paenibacillus silvae]